MISVHYTRALKTQGMQLHLCRTMHIGVCFHAAGLLGRGLLFRALSCDLTYAWWLPSSNAFYIYAQVYASMLLGFLVADCSAAQALAASLMPGGTLDPLVAAIQQCLAFYISAGAITDVCVLISQMYRG